MTCKEHLEELGRNGICISDILLHQKLSLPKCGIQYLYGKKDLFAVVIAFRHLLPKENFMDFKRKLTAEISKTTKNLVHITETELLEHMGFPNNWEISTAILFPI